MNPSGLDWFAEQPLSTRLTWVAFGVVAVYLVGWGCKGGRARAPRRTASYDDPRRRRTGWRGLPGERR